MAFPVSVIQLDISPEHPEENREAALSLCTSAIDSGARIVLLPEAAITDFYPGAERLAETIPGPLTEAFQRVAGDAIVALPLLEACEVDNTRKIFSACALIGSAGLLGIARRTHLYFDPTGFELLNEKELLTPGAELAVIDASGIRVGFALGFDAQFPEVFRTLAIKGADIILCAQNCVAPDVGFLSAMARCNRMPIAVANRVGFKRVFPAQPEFSAMTQTLIQDSQKNFMLRCKGGSVILGPNGEFCAEAVAESRATESPPAELPDRAKIPQNYFQDEQIISASFQFDELRIERLTHPLLTARRPELYGPSIN